MLDLQEKQERDSAVVVKAGVWYTVCNFLVKGMAFITTPIFARILSPEELGSFTNFTSWINILLVLTSFDLSQSIIRSKMDFEGDIDSYIWSILSFSTICTLIIYAIVCIFHGFFEQILSMEMKYIHVMFMYLIVFPAYQMLITKHRAYYRYKLFAILTAIMVISSVLLSLVMVFLLENKLTGRIVGYYLPYILFGAGIYIVLACKGKKIKIQYWKYASVICIPLVPHVLSMHLLNSFGKIMLTSYHGEAYTAVFSIAYSCSYVTSTLFDSMNKAWAPWLLDSLHDNYLTEIRRVSKVYITVFAFLIIGMLLVVPELVWILGGAQYAAAVYCVPPLVAGCMFQFIYTMYVNIEFYKKRTVAVAGATLVAALTNILLNLLLLPGHRENSYVIAGYTALIGYIVLFVLHYFLVKRMDMAHIYDTRYILIVLSLVLLVSIGVNFLYEMWLPIRYALLLCYCVLLGWSVLKNKNAIRTLLKKKRVA